MHKTKILLQFLLSFFIDVVIKMWSWIWRLSMNIYCQKFWLTKWTLLHKSSFVMCTPKYLAVLTLHWCSLDIQWHVNMIRHTAYVADSAGFLVVLSLPGVLISRRSGSRSYVQVGDGHLSVPSLFSPGPEVTLFIAWGKLTMLWCLYFPFVWWSFSQALLITLFVSMP